MSTDDTEDENQTFVVADLDGFCDRMLVAATEIHGELVSNAQRWEVEKLLREHNLGRNEDGQFIVSLQTINNLQRALVDIHFGLLLNKMVSAGELECSWDAETDQPLFRLSAAMQQKLDAQ